MSRNISILRRDQSEFGNSSDLKSKSELIPGLDYGHELLANSKYTPPVSPQPSEGPSRTTSRHLQLDESNHGGRDSRSRSRRSDEASHISIDKIVSRSKSRQDSRRDSRRESRHESRRESRRDAMPIMNESDYQVSEAPSRSRRGGGRSRDDMDRNINDIIAEESNHGGRSHRNRDHDNYEREYEYRDHESSRERSRIREREREHDDYRDRDRDRDRDHDRDRDRERSERSNRDSDRDRDRDDRRDRDYDDRSRDRSRGDSEGTHVNLMDEDMEKLRDQAMEDGMEDSRIDVTKLSPQEIMKKKRKALLHIKILEKQGYEPFKEVGLTNPLEEIIEVEEEAMERRSLTNGIEFGKKLLVGSSYVIESANRKFDPFDLKLDGWSDQMFEDRDEYNEVMEELYYKYSDQVAMSPEVKLLMMVGGSAMMFHFSKTLMASGNLEVPNFDAIMNRNPELKRAYEQAAMNHMMDNNKRGGGSQQAPNMISNILGNMTGDPGMGDALNAFMTAGGPPSQQMKVHPTVPAEIPARSTPASRVKTTPRAATSAPPRKSKAQSDIEIIPPADPDNILGGGGGGGRATRRGRDNLTTLVI